MPTIKGFSTKKDVLTQVKDSGATIVFGFESKGGLQVELNPFESVPADKLKSRTLSATKKKLSLVKQQYGQRKRT